MIHMPLAILLHTIQAQGLPGPMFGLRSLKYLGYHEGLSFIPPESLLKDELQIRSCSYYIGACLPIHNLIIADQGHVSKK